MFKNFIKVKDEQLINILNNELAGIGTILDIGCGENSPLRLIRDKKEIKLIGYDAYLNAIQISRAKSIHSHYILDNIENIQSHFTEKGVDCVAALDVIEHFEKANGEKLLSVFEKIARKKVIIYTPNGFLKQDVLNGNIYQVHRSGWTTREFRERGYKVIGIHGYRLFRGKLGGISLWPVSLWRIVSYLTYSFFETHPWYAFQLLAIKNV